MSQFWVNQRCLRALFWIQSAGILAILSFVVAGCGREKRVEGAEVQVVAERLAISKVKTPQDIVPYDEALVWHEYAVKKVLHGSVDSGKIRVAHWCVVGSKAVPVEEEIGQKVTLSLSPFEETPALADVAKSDDLDFTVELPRYLDLEQTRDAPQTPEALRHDYQGFFSEQMALYWKLRGQLRLVAMGNSLATKGIATREFFPGQNHVTPVALNLAPAGANNDMQCLIVREYLLPLPKLEWVVWVVSPRSFNAERDEKRKLKEFLASPGWRHDQDNKATLWPVPPLAKPVTVDELESIGGKIFDFWGWEGRKLGDMPDLEDETKLRAYLADQLKVSNFVFGEELWQEFVSTVRGLNARGVKVLLLNAPLHPWGVGAPAADPDWTSHEGMAQLLSILERLDEELPLTWFRDFHQGGHHDFGPEEFYDPDHLNRKGAVDLTRRIMTWMKECEGGYQRPEHRPKKH